MKKLSKGRIIEIKDSAIIIESLTKIEIAFSKIHFIYYSNKIGNIAGGCGLISFTGVIVFLEYMNLFFQGKFSIPGMILGVGTLVQDFIVFSTEESLIY